MPLSRSDNETMALEALSKAADALQVLKALIKPPHTALTVEQAIKSTRVVNDGYDHAVATLVALGWEESGSRR